MRTAIYCRISDDRAGDSAGVTRQEKDCRQLIKAKGWKVVGVFTDNDVSAYSGKRRAAYERMMDAVRAGEFDVVVAWHPDRLHRSPIELEHFIDLIEKKKVAVATVTAGHYDLSNPTGRMNARNIGNFARYESEHKSERQKAKAEELARLGKSGGGGSRPFGFEDDRVTIRKSESKEIKQAAAKILAGGSIYSILMDWRARGVVSSAGGVWRPSVFKRMISSPRIAGLRQYQGEVIGPAEWKGIIPEADHYALRALLSDPSRRLNAHSRSYLLTGGAARCGLCGQKLVARPKSGGIRSYVCANGPAFGGCGKIRAIADTLEAHVRDFICEKIKGQALADALEAAASEDPDRHEAAAQVRTLEASLEQLAKDHYVDGAISRSEFFAARDALKAKLEPARARLASTTTSPMLAVLPSDQKALARLWDDQDMDWRRQLVSVLVDEVIVGPAVPGRNFFDPDRVTVTWRF